MYQEVPDTEKKDKLLNIAATDDDGTIEVQKPPENVESPSMIENAADRRIPPGSVLKSIGDTGNFGLNGKLFLRIVFWWVITVPAAFGGAYVIELIAK